jgi:TPR repeat protein
MIIDEALYDEIIDRQITLPFTGFTAAPSPVHDLHIQAADGNLDSIFALSKLYDSGNEVPQDQDFAFRLLQYTAEQGYEPSFAVVGKCLAFGIATQQNPEMAVHYFRQTDYSKDVDILAFMAWCYHNGIGVHKDEIKSYDIWLDAAELGHSEAFCFCKSAADAGYARGQFTLGHYYQHGIGVPPNVQYALHLFHQAANQNYAPAQSRLGLIYLEGNNNIEKDPAVAIKWFRLAVTQNDPLARHMLAFCLASGDGIKQNKEEAAELWRGLADENNPTAQYNLGALLTDKEYAGYNPKMGIKLLRKSAKQHFALAQTMLGIYYYEGFDNIIKQNTQDARQWFHKAAKRGDSVAQYYLGELFYEGNGVAANHKKAVEYYQQSSNACYVPAMQKLAHCFISGIGTQKNEDEGYMLLSALALWKDEEALTLLQSAAASGNPAAEFGMSVYYWNKNDVDISIDWLEKSADKRNANALYAMAIRYEGEGDNEQSLRYFRLAAEQNNAEAQYRLGLLLEDLSDRKAPGNEEAFQWMQAAAEQKHPAANYCLGNFYRDGTWVDVDVQKAVECYTAAAEKGNSDAIDRLGECFLYGVGVAADQSMAFLHFQRAAEVGNPKGQCHLGLCYLQGIGCHQNTDLAFQWITSAIDTGHPVVIKRLQGVGLDIGRFCEGFQRSQKILSVVMGDRFGDYFDHVFCNPAKPALTPIPPSDSVE